MGCTRSRPAGILVCSGCPASFSPARDHPPGSIRGQCWLSSSSEEGGHKKAIDRAGAERLGMGMGGPSKPMSRQHRKGTQGATCKVRCLDGPCVPHLVPERGSWGQEPVPGGLECKTGEQSTQTLPPPSLPSTEDLLQHDPGWTQGQDSECGG